MRPLLLALAACLLRFAMPASATSPPAVIHDSDLDVDDAATLAYLCAEHHRGRIDLRAVTVTGNGFGYPDRVRRHALSVLRECGLRHVPVAEGVHTAVHAAPAEARADVEDVLSGALEDGAEHPAPTGETATDLIRRTLAESRGGVTVLATGPLSNLAAALPAGDRLIRRIAAVHVMGGAVAVPGNLFGSALPGFDNSQELNAWMDPAAAAAVFRTLPAVHLTPLDATDRVPITQAYVDRLGADLTTPNARIAVRAGLPRRAQPALNGVGTTPPPRPTAYSTQGTWGEG
ncbi:nucleoside hydrolase [Umezawaea tangerina]|uniref:Inosine-uridine preferring nucleoside hydrolase n=1 Tax=Umezawaea tangerina TaxID=84725 RepID=A0A2T0SSF0_9PSEU|nr:nucleoside hydrolase [Umezawaea tangerina]PRY36337.1 inosine-uridine preferring nucleoside hydrolase [Umezawaea tangerina]